MDTRKEQIKRKIEMRKSHTIANKEIIKERIKDKNNNFIRTDLKTNHNHDK
jgi:hypothetical protein